MKKLFLLCSVAFIFACSNENEVPTQENATIENATTTASKSEIPIEDEIDEMFYEYVNSSEFIDSYNSVREFTSHFKVIVTKEYFSTNNEMFDWIDNNLDKTSFSSVEEAQLKWTNIINLNISKIEKFPNIFEFIRNEDKEIATSYFIKWFPNNNTTSDDYCSKLRKECETQAMMDYISDTAGAVFSNPTVFGAMIANADFWYDLRISSCGSSYRHCIGV